MRKIRFDKYQGTGNDFVIIDQTNESQPLTLSQKEIAEICDRRFGIGADGLIIVEKDPDYDYRMVYYNADGAESTMCGNGGRCISAFAHKHKVVSEDKAEFVAIDGPHESIVDDKKDIVDLKMKDVDEVTIEPNRYILDTGSPHYVTFVEDIDDIDVRATGRAIRYSSRFSEEGINVNFVEQTDEGILVATYERGVEDQTYSCGTGVVASAISAYLCHPDEYNAQNVIIPVKTIGGDLTVRFRYDEEQKICKDVWLVGPATFVFAGEIEI